MEKEKKPEERLQLWQERLAVNQAAYAKELDDMEKRNDLYQGSRVVDGKPGKEVEGGTEPASMVRNIISELVEAQVDSSVPMPKVTARREEDEKLAKTIEAYLRNEVDRLPFEMINDMDERVTPVQGGNFFFIEWDATKHTHTTRGELSVRLLHPKQVIPQDGVTEIEDMDFIIVRMAMTKQKVKTLYGKDVTDEGEEDAAIRGGDSVAVDVVTVNYGYFRNEKGGIGRYAWVNDIELEYMEDYQARILRKCRACGAPMPGDTCPECGGKKAIDQEETGFDMPANLEGFEPYQTAEDGTVSATKVPYYKPNIYPIVIRRNVSSWGRVLGDSDTDKIRDQQNAIKKCDTRVQEKLDKGGSVLTKHIDSKMEMSDAQLKVVEVQNPSEVSCLGVYNLQSDTSGDLAVAEQNYQSARNILGITDSFQGRKDTTATSGRAKEIAVSQSAGRLESKRIMKNTVYADLYQVMFQFLLAYSDQPRTVRSDKLDGSTDYNVFDRMDFLAQDDAGELYWKDDFLFSVDTSSALASNRETMWQEVRQNFETGAFGDPHNPQTLLLFWRMMAKLHYPMAEEIRTQLEEQQEMAMQEQEQMQQMQPDMMQEMVPESELPPELMMMMQQQMVPESELPPELMGGNDIGMY